MKATSEPATAGAATGETEFGGAQQAVDRVGLAADLGGDPARQHRDEAGRPHDHGAALEPAAAVEAAAPAQPDADQAEQGHEKADRDHDPEAPEHDRRVRPVLRRPRLQAAHLAVQTMGEDQAAELRDRERVVGPLGRHVRHAEQDQGRAALRLEMALHRRDLGRLMLEGVEAVQVARDDLDRRHQGRHPQRHREHHARAFVGAIFQQVKGADRADDERGRQIGRQHHVHQPVGERRVEDDRPPVRGHELADLVDRVAGRRLHPAVRGQDPERREQRAGGDHQGGEVVQPLADPAHAEQHHAEEARLEKEGAQHLVAQQGAQDGPGLVREHAPVGAELVAHHDAGDDAHRRR